MLFLIFATNTLEISITQKRVSCETFRYLQTVISASLTIPYKTDITDKSGFLFNLIANRLQYVVYTMFQNKLGIIVTRRKTEDNEIIRNSRILCFASN